MSRKPDIVMVARDKVLETLDRVQTGLPDYQYRDLLDALLTEIRAKQEAHKEQNKELYL